MNTRSFALAAAIGGVVFTTAPAGACFWPPAVCALIGQDVPPEPVSAAAAEPPPVELETFVREAPSKPAPRVSRKQDDGPASEKTAEKRKPPKKQAAAPKPKAAEPEPLKPEPRFEPPKPAVVQSEPVRAPYAFDATAFVRVVSADEFNEIDLAAPPAISAMETTGIGVRGVQVVDPVEVNDLDRRADAIRTAALDMPTRLPAMEQRPPAQDEAPSWLQRTFSRLGAAFASVSAAVRSLFG